MGGKQRHVEELLDVDDVGLGYQNRMRWNDRSEWVWSNEVAHEPLISDELFEAADRQRLLNDQRRRAHALVGQAHLPLASLVYSGALHEDGSVCDRRMTGAWANAQGYYRCGYPAEYKGAKGLHPEWVYLKEADVLPALDDWLLGHFDPKHIDATVEALAAAQEPDDAAAARAEAARARLADCDKRMANLRKQVEGGTAPDIVMTWIREVEVECLAGERELASTAPSAQPLSETEIRW